MKQATLVRNYWIGVVSKTHVDKAVAGGYTQLNHGKAGPLERMREGDGFAFYSPRIDHPYGAPLQAFTAIGRVGRGAIFQADEGDGFVPFRRAVDYLPAHEAPMKPLIFRAAASTGFRAPSLSQSWFSSVATNFIRNTTTGVVEPFEVWTAPVSSMA